MSKHSGKKKASQATEHVEATPDSVFKAINDIRMKMQLPKLHWQKDFARFADKYARNLEFCLFDLNTDFVILSQFCFRDLFYGQTTDDLIESWLIDNSKRPILLAPGNYGIVTIVDDPDKEGDGSQAIVVYIASICR